MTAENRFISMLTTTKLIIVKKQTPMLRKCKLMTAKKQTSTIQQLN